MKDHEVVAYKRLKPMENTGKSLNRQTQIVWSPSLTGGGRLLEVPNVRLSLGKYVFVFCLGAGGRSLTKGSHSRRFDCTIYSLGSLTF